MRSDLTDEPRPYDIVVVGASGFTGRLVVEYLADKYPADAPVRWAVAGRNREKLEKVIAEFCPSGDKPTIVVADSHDGSALRQLARDTRVVLTTVGPYAKYGSELVAACVESGTHYCDLAGEAQWIRRMLDEHQADAVESGAKIVNSCGFDSIPSDIGVFYLQQQAMETCGDPGTRSMMKCSSGVFVNMQVFSVISVPFAFGKYLAVATRKISSSSSVTSRST